MSKRNSSAEAIIDLIIVSRAQALGGLGDADGVAELQKVGDPYCIPHLHAYAQTIPPSAKSVRAVPSSEMRPRIRV